MKPATDPLKAFMAARTALLLDQPFFGALALRLKVKVDPTCQTAWTDGTTLGFNPTYLTDMSQSRRIGLLAHEVVHCTNGHPWRRDGRDPRLWNLACDYAIDSILTDAGFDVPDATINPEWRGMSAEAIYSALKSQPRPEAAPQPEPGPQPEPEPTPDDDSDNADNSDDGPEDPQKEGQEEGQEEPTGDAGDPDEETTPDENGPSSEAIGNKESADISDDSGDGSGSGQGDEPGDPSSFGEVRDCPNPQDAAEEEAEWQQAILQAAAAAQQQGRFPAGMKRVVDSIREPACRDLIAALQEFVARAAREDFSWKMPNRRYLPAGFYLPSLRSETLPPIAAAVDTSGSISSESLSRFTAAVQSVLDEMRPEAISVYACDARMQAERDLVPGDQIGSDMADFPGGGGTDFRPVFSRIEERTCDGEPVPCAAVYLTDLYGVFPETEPEYPVLWVVWDIYGLRPKAPFGQTIYLD